MVKRVRNIPYKIFVSDKEDELIKEKMKKVNMTNKSEYARKMMIDGLIINTDYTPIKELAFHISKVGNNINQIARQANQMDHLNKSDVVDLLRMLDTISENQKKTLKLLMQGMK